MNEKGGELLQTVLQSLFPVLALLAAGAALKRLGMTGDAFLRTSDRLVYFIFFPVMLFWKIGSATGAAAIEAKLCLAAICAVASVYALSTACILFFKVGDYQAGTFSQSAYRFNSYIGMAVVLMALGEEGARRFGVLIGFTIPFINLLAVPTLIWFSGDRSAPGKRLAVTLKALMSNPLILGCFAGILFSWTGLAFPVYLHNTFQLTSSVTLPLALLSIGGALSLRSLRGYFHLSLAAALFKLVVLPAVGFFFLRIFSVPDLSFRVGMIFFALPTSPSIYVLSSQLNSDTELASAAIVLSTVLSFGVLTGVLAIGG